MNSFSTPKVPGDWFEVDDVKVVLLESDGKADYYTADVRSYSNYYAFGMQQPGRSFVSSTGYRYGFNGKEKDGEWNSGGAMYDYGFRIYDPRIAKFLSVDPLTKDYPWYTPYQFAGNKPIWAVDLDGKEELIYIRFNDSKTSGQTVFKLEPSGNAERVKFYKDFVMKNRAPMNEGENQYKYAMGGLSPAAPAKGVLVVDIWDDGAVFANYYDADFKKRTYNMTYGIQTYGNKSEGEDNVTADHVVPMDAIFFDILKRIGKGPGFEKPATLKKAFDEVVDRKKKIEEWTGKEGFIIPVGDGEKGNTRSREQFVCPTCSQTMEDTTGHNDELSRDQAPAPGYEKVEE